MQAPTFSPAPDLVQVALTWEAEGTLWMRLTTRRPAAPCPRCGQLSRQVHSRYCRTLALRPWAGLPRAAQLQTRRWFCRNPDCSQRIFTERLPALVARSARRAADLAAWLRFLGYRLGGEEGARATVILGFGVSPDTVLRELQRATSRPGAAATGVVHLGVDDFALRKGQRYATLLIDLDTRQPLDLLPDREVESLAAWLREHPEVEYVSRDGSKLYAAAIAQGAPQAEQGTDRFHLAQGLTEALLAYFRHEETQLTGALQAGAQAAAAERAAAAPAAAAPLEDARGGPPPKAPPPGDTPPGGPPPAETPPGDTPRAPARYGASAREREESGARRQRRLETYQAVKESQAAGGEAPAIAATLGIHLQAARRLMHASAFPERRPYRRRETCLTPYREYLERRWAEGGRDPGALWEELRNQGFTHGPSAVAKWVGSRWQAHVAAGGVRPPRPRRASPTSPAEKTPSLRTGMWQLLHAFRTAAGGGEPLTAPDPPGAFTTAFFREAPETRRAVSLVGEFLQLLTSQRRAAAEGKRGREGLAGQLEAWMERVEASGIRSLRSYCTGLRQDWEAVLSGLTQPWSNGVVEGHVNRVKLIKRQMYGRGNPATLRTRVVPLCR